MSNDQSSSSNEIRDRELVLAYVSAYPGRHFQEAEIKQATQVNKAIIRRLLRGVPEIDQAVLEKGAVCWIGEAPAAV